VYKPGTSAALRGYYYNAVVPTMKRVFWEHGERYTDEQTERILREYSSIMHQQSVDPETGKYTDEIRSIIDLDNSELIEHIETIKQLAAEEFSVYIEDPNTI
jgi:predicted patatin/cPLA2 family phospholipase